ncbi:protein MKS1-like [Cynara cardunculus var. scolymus]|uniref:VQ domain-containing protein n=1 Tax=Cynara cardunculus var. scolymus TaxID=59895 RepID=A0A103YDP9_CYNCS|nr:protein MKS1-like [Cynara cardunculus var. scolymus]KVI07196.1 hypothetical protein Ccrd_014439 [Cynara cardunculus var. scolymus]
MDSPDFPTGTAKSPRTLQGPRPAPLRVRKDSHKIRKPPVAPPPQQHHHHPQQIQPQHRPPVIIYTVSPKVIHTNPNEFMTLVQRLTGPPASSPIASSFSAFHDDGGAVSPAARFASLQKAENSPDGRKVPQNGDVAVVEGVEIATGLEKSGYFPGILSPGPASLPPIPPNFFSPLANDQNPLSFFPDLSPVFHNTRNYNYLEGNSSNSFIMPSPSNLLSPYLISPNTLNLFSTLFD